jgi:[acyl-carrier-protein] S-malonyltransferase
MSFAFVFPGQGSQSVGMMAAYGDSAVVRATFDEASGALGDDLWTMVADGPAEVLAQTVNTQPVMLTAGIAAWRLWREKGGRMPAVVAGHSLGEYSALVAAGVIELKDAVPLVRLRAAAMQEAVPFGTGAMAAILGLDDAGIAAACAEAAQGEVVEPVNFNANGPDRHRRPQGGCRARHGGLQGAWRQDGQGAAGIGTVPFFADPPAADKLAARLAELTLNAPRIPVINNVDVAIESDPAQIKDALVRQAYNPVRWVEIIQVMAAMGVSNRGRMRPRARCWPA